MNLNCGRTAVQLKQHWHQDESLRYTSSELIHLNTRTLYKQIHRAKICASSTKQALQCAEPALEKKASHYKSNASKLYFMLPAATALHIFSCSLPASSYQGQGTEPRPLLNPCLNHDLTATPDPLDRLPQRNATPCQASSNAARHILCNSSERSFTFCRALQLRSCQEWDVSEGWNSRKEVSKTPRLTGLHWAACVR